MIEKVGHFLVSELACRDGSPYPNNWVNDPTRGAPLLRLLNGVRDLHGHPVYVVSGYRSENWNRFLIERDKARGLHNVASGSEHVEGRAADVHAGEMTSPAELHELIYSAWHRGALPDLGGLALYDGWVHMDVRERKQHLAQWGARILRSAS